MTILKSPFEFATVAAVAACGVYFGQTNQLIESATTNTVNANDYSLAGLDRSASVDSTVQFIQANYDDLFKRLAE